MGYLATGSISITLLEETQLTTAALLQEDVARRAYPARPEDILADMTQSDGDIILRALEASGFSDGYRREEDGRVVYSAYYDRKWWEGATFVHLLAAESGMKVEATFRGEDDESWAWDSHDGRFVEEELISVPGSRFNVLLQGQRDLISLHQLLCGNRDPSSDELAQARSILAAYATPAEESGEDSVTGQRA